MASQNTPNNSEDAPKVQEVTKRSIRVETWQKMKKERAAPPGSFNLFNKIPNFHGSDTAAQLLAETDEFKKAKSIKVNIDVSQEPVKLEVIKADKTLYVPPARTSSKLFAKVTCPADADVAAQKKIIKLQGPEDSIVEIDIDDKVTLDMIVVGSCAVSRTGQRLGKGNGYVDLDIGILLHLGIITKDTLIVTTVHDTQVHDTLPSELFQKYDLPLDLIVTPTEVIRIQKRLPRPTGIYWELLSNRRLEIVPVLKKIKENDESAGKIIELKSEDTDVESFPKRERFRRRDNFGRRNRLRRRRTNRPDQNGEENQEEGEKSEGENKKKDGGLRRNRRHNRKPKRDQSNKENEESGQEKSEGEQKSEGENKSGRPDRRNRKNRNKSARNDNNRRQERDLCIKVSNITKQMRIKDLKTELRTRGCHPMFITWKAEDVTKRSIRVETWQTMKKERVGSYNLFNKIPNFHGSDEAAQLLAETDEFKKAKSVKVNIDVSQEPVKLAVIKADKTLYVPSMRTSSKLFAKVTCPADADVAAQKKIIKLQGPEDSIVEIDIDDKVTLDMIVVGSCAVSRTGQRLGKGNGYVDLDIGILLHLGIITNDTLIVTTVHDTQVYDTLPSELFQKYDLPLDLIVTPTEVIRIQKRLPRPTGIYWELLSNRRLEIVPVLKKIKENDESDGKIIELKSEDTDVESFRSRDNFGRRNGLRRRRTNRPEENHEEGEKSEGEQKSEDETKSGRPARRNRRKSARNDNNRRQEDDLCIKVSNITKQMRIKDLKTELRTRGCQPLYITWKGFNGKCYLHFLKKSEQQEDDAVKELLDQLSNLSLTVTKNEDQEEQVSLQCEVMKRREENQATENGTNENQVETTDVTAV